MRMQTYDAGTMKFVLFYSDYVCPYCLLAERMLTDAIGDRNILRPDPVPTLRPEDPYLPTVWRQSVYPLAERLGVPIRLLSISPQPRTAKAFQLLAMAQYMGLDHEYSMRVLRAFFQEDRDIGDQEVLIELAADAGLDSGEARQAIESGTYTDRHREALHRARKDMSITSIPTLAVGERIFRGTPVPQEVKKAIDQLERDAGNDGRPHHHITGEWSCIGCISESP